MKRKACDVEDPEEAIETRIERVKAEIASYRDKRWMTRLCNAKEDELGQLEARRKNAAPRVEGSSAPGDPPEQDTSQPRRDVSRVTRPQNHVTRTRRTRTCDGACRELRGVDEDAGAAEEGEGDMWSQTGLQRNSSANGGDEQLHVAGVSPKPEMTPDAQDCPVLDLDGEDFCAQCDIPMRLVPSKALMVCTKCGCFTSYIDATTSSMAYGEEIEISSMYCYKRLNHFRLQLSQLQATESCEISQDIIDKVLEALVARGVTKPERVTVGILREVLKKLKFRRCYDHIPQIMSRITGKPPVRLTPDLIERCRLMFINIQAPFEKHCPPERKNFISYRYLLYKMFQLLGYDEVLPYMTLLKGKEKLLKQDMIFKKICQDLDWQFIPSL